MEQRVSINEDTTTGRSYRRHAASGNPAKDGSFGRTRYRRDLTNRQPAAAVGKVNG
jgi:hypothetical protein